MAWHLAPSLVRLRNEINSRWPSRDKSSDGSIGDAAHSSRTSDHNPNSRGSVNAIDVDKDGIDPWYLVATAIKHPATNYVIFNRKIWSRSYGFRERYYSGSNPHDKHVHVSIRQTTTAENSTQGWGIGSGGTAPAPNPSLTVPPYGGVVLKSGSRGQAVKDVQYRLNTRGYTAISVDGVYGPATVDRVKKFQTYARIQVDGEVGPITWDRLWSLPVT